MSQLNNILSAKSSTKPPGSNTSHVRGAIVEAARASQRSALMSSSTRDLVDGCTSLTATARPRRRPLRASGVVSIRGRDDASMASRRRQSRSTRPRESLVLAPRRCRCHDCHKPWRTLRNAPPDVRDAARADRPAEDRITAGERVGERPQGFASRLRRARRAVLQEPAAPAPVFPLLRWRVVFFQASTPTNAVDAIAAARSAESSRRPPRHRGDDDSATLVRTKPRERRRAASPTTARA